MSRTLKAAAVLAAVALAGLSAAGTASAVTLNHHAAPAARTAVAEADAVQRPAVEAGSTSVGPAGRNCTRGHLSHGHC